MALTSECHLVKYLEPFQASRCWGCHGPPFGFVGHPPKLPLTPPPEDGKQPPCLALTTINHGESHRLRLTTLNACQHGVNHHYPRSVDYRQKLLTSLKIPHLWRRMMASILINRFHGWWWFMMSLPCWELHPSGETSTWQVETTRIKPSPSVVVPCRETRMAPYPDSPHGWHLWCPNHESKPGRIMGSLVCLKGNDAWGWLKFNDD